MLKLLHQRKWCSKRICRIWCVGGKSMLFRLEILQNFRNKLMIIKNMRHFFLSFKWLKMWIHIQNKKWNNLCLCPPLPGHSISNWDIHAHTHTILKKYEFFLRTWFLYDNQLFLGCSFLSWGNCWKGSKQAYFYRILIEFKCPSELGSVSERQKKHKSASCS